MSMENFIKNFADQLEDTALEQLSATTKFKELDEWSSLTTLAIIGMVDEEYDVRLKAEDLKNSVTIEDLFNLVNERR